MKSYKKKNENIYLFSLLFSTYYTKISQFITFYDSKIYNDTLNIDLILYIFGRIIS